MKNPRLISASRFFVRLLPAAILLAAVSVAFGQEDWRQMNDYVAPSNQIPLDGSGGQLDMESGGFQADIADTEALEGRQIMESKCMACHDVPRPDSRNISDWPAVLSEMGPRAGLSTRDYKLIMAYLARSLQTSSPNAEWNEIEERGLAPADEPLPEDQVNTYTDSAQEKAGRKEAGEEDSGNADPKAEVETSPGPDDTDEPATEDNGPILRDTAADEMKGGEAGE